MYHSGERVNVGQFSHEMVGHMIEDYGANVKALSERRWLRIMDIIGIAQITEDLPRPNVSSMQQKRHTLYVASSPPAEE